MEIQFLHLQKFQGRIWKGAMKGKRVDKQIKELNREKGKRERKKDRENRKMVVSKVLFEILKYSMNL